VPPRPAGGAPGVPAPGPFEEDRPTADLRPRAGGPFPGARPLPADVPHPGATRAGGGGPSSRSELPDSLLLRIGDIPLRTVYAFLALIATIAAVILVFIVFDEDPPPDTASTTRASAAGAAPQDPASAEPTPTPQVRLPAPPRAKSLDMLPGTAAPVIGLVVDEEAGLTYPRLGEPWTTTTARPFTAAQRAGSARAPQALIASAPLPGTVPADLSTAERYRALAVRAARWTLRYQPTPTKVTWTASQSFAGGRGWVLGYRVAYEVDGESRTSQAVVVVADTGKAKPGLLFATVPDSRPDQFRDLNTIVESVQVDD